MKNKWKLLAVLCLMVCLAPLARAAEPVYPNYTGFVNDFTGTIDPASKVSLEALCRALEAKTSAELAIAVVKTVAPLDSKTYAVKLFEKWQIGKKGKDNGLLVLLALDERRVEIEVGYGLEGVINDAKAGEILDMYGVPYFKSGDYAAGLYNIAAALSEQVAAAAGQELGDQYQPTSGGPRGSADNWGTNDTVLSVAVVIIAVFSIFFSGLMAGIIGAIIGALFGVFLWGPAGGAVGALLGFVVSFFRFFGGFGGGGGWTGGLFGGGDLGGGDSGFGGFGGGGSGGGGAGRSW